MRNLNFWGVQKGSESLAAFQRTILQKRSRNKNVARSKWDTSAGRRVTPGEDILEAAKRAIKEMTRDIIHTSRFCCFFLKNAVKYLFIIST
jgi:hypothetical protein